MEGNSKPVLIKERNRLPDCKNWLSCHSADRFPQFKTNTRNFSGWASDPLQLDDQSKVQYV